MRIRLPLALLTGAALLSCATVVPSLAGAATPAPLPGTTKVLLRNATVSGPAPTGTRQRVVLALALRDNAGLTRLLSAQQTPGSADYHRWLSPAQFAARFAPSTAAVETARSWATSAGLTVNEISSNRTLVTVTGTRAQLDRAFHVTLLQVRTGSASYVTPDRTATLPASVRAVTKAVLGLSTYQVAHRPIVTAKASPYQPYALASYGPRDFNAIYHAPPATTGTGQTVAVITDGDLAGVRMDLTLFEQRNSLPRVPLTVVQTTRASSDTSGALEYDLDTQYATGFAPGVKSLLAYNADSLGDIHPLNRFVTDRKALTASASYGGCETLNALAGVVDADDQIFKQGQAQGQTFWFSSGDDGSACSILPNTGTPAGIPDVEYPSSSPYVVAVGGTSLTGQSSQPLREISWLGGGGGYSVIENAPAWQKANLGFSPAIGRGVPDVSLDADPFSGYNVVVSGVDTAVGGTSASAPAWNGIWARVLQRHPGIGFAAPALYRSRAGLVDITVGSNGMYQATSGYDLTTGLGTVDITALVAAIR